MLAEADRACGYAYGPGEKTAEEMASAAQGEPDPAGELRDYIAQRYGQPQEDESRRPE